MEARATNRRFPARFSLRLGQTSFQKVDTAALSDGGVAVPESSGRTSRPVSRVLYGDDRSPRDGHSSWAPVAGHLTQPTRATGLETGWLAPRRPYSVLLPVGFAMPVPLPVPRWALTPPFHPYPTAEAARAVCFLRHFPWGRPRRALPGTVFPWSPDFPLRRSFDMCRSGRPANWWPRDRWPTAHASSDGGFYVHRHGSASSRRSSVCSVAASV